MAVLDRKVARDLWRIRGQALAIGLVIACGIATFVMSINTLQSLEVTQQAYYERYRFPHVFAHLKRAPMPVAQRIAAIPGVARVAPRIVVHVTLDVEGLDEPATGRLISIPERGRPALNDLHLRRGRWIEPGGRGEVLVSDAFAEAHGLEPGDRVGAVINGKLEDLRIVGVALSPEYVFQMASGEMVPDDRRFGVFWMGQENLAAAFDMTGAFNDVVVALLRGTPEADVIQRLDTVLEPHGGVGAYGRTDQVSHRYLTDEMRGLRGMGLIAPTIFLGVAAFLLNVVVSRQVRTQREQIAVLRAYGYRRWDIALHYLKFVMVIALVGAACGVLLGGWLGRGLTEMYTRFYRFPVFFFALEWRTVLAGILVSVGAASIGAIGTVIAGASLPPAEAMRPEPPAEYRATIVERLGLARFLPHAARMILRHLERHPVKALMSAFGISLGTAVLVLGAFMEDALEYLIEFQFYTAQRQDVSVNFVEPIQTAVMHDIARLRGVQQVEPFRAVPVRLTFGHRSRRTGITALGERRDLFRLFDADERPVRLPPGGLVLGGKLAELLGAGIGDRVKVEVLEGKRHVQEVPVVARIEEYAGIAAYMHLDAVRDLLGEGPTVSGAFMSVDPRIAPELYRDLKRVPRVAGVTVREATIESFRKTIGENQQTMRTVNVIFAVIIAFGVVYNTARVSLSERGRDLATLRVIGFTRGEVSAILLGELAILTLVAIPLGLAIGVGFAWMVISAFESELYRFPLVIDRSTFLFASLVTVVAAAFSALIVRRRIDQLDLVAVLKTRE